MCIRDRTPAVEVQPAAEIQPAAPAAEAVQTASAEPKTAPLSMVEVILFCVLVVGVIALGIWNSRDPEETEEEKKAKGASDYFLACLLYTSSAPTHILKPSPRWWSCAGRPERRK